MLILLDSNEQATNPKFVEELKVHFPKLNITSLEFGDLNIILKNGDILAVERKEAGDFLGSIGDGRVFRQVEKMAAGAKFYCIIIVGSMVFNEEDMTVVNGEVTGWKGKSVRGAIHALQWSACPIFFTTRQMFPFTLMEVIDFCNKPVEHVQKHHHRVVTFPPLEPAVEIISSFPGIGVKRAQALMDFVARTDYASLGGALAWASAFPLIKEGSRPEGWGNKMVAQFRALLGLKDNQYLEIKDG